MNIKLVNPDRVEISLTTYDLTSHNLSLKDFKHNSPMVQSFIRHVCMRKAEKLGFDFIGTPLALDITVQAALPDMVVADEDDVVFIAISKADLPPEVVAGLSASLQPAEIFDTPQENSIETTTGHKYFLCVFNNTETLKQGAFALQGYVEYKTTLYKQESSYYLTLQLDPELDYGSDMAMAKLSEFGAIRPCSELELYRLEEHAQRIALNNAVDIVCEYY